ncbi:MAG: TatD family hydrolase [Desulfobacterales bacterium]|nr:TatD family hydrolase [Desulfobacterales bacterium]
MKLFDTHCHLDDRAYKNDMDAVVSRAHAAGVLAMMTVGTDKQSSQKAVAMAETIPGLFASVGTHPHDAKDIGKTDLDFMRNLAKSPKVKAWGEIGLDFNRMYSPREIQEDWFVDQLSVADELGLPIIFHERDSDGRLIELLKKHPSSERKGVIHCFSGNENELQQYLEMGFYIGITGILTLKDRGAGLRELSCMIPQDRLVVETDAPYLTPAPEKNHTRRNEPAFVRSVMFKLSQVRGNDPEALASIVWENSCSLYRIPHF